MGQNQSGSGDSLGEETKDIRKETETSLPIVSSLDRRSEGLVWDLFYKNINLIHEGSTLCIYCEDTVGNSYESWSALMSQEYTACCSLSA